MTHLVILVHFNLTPMDGYSRQEGIKFAENALLVQDISLRTYPQYEFATPNNRPQKLRGLPPSSVCPSS